MAIPSSLFIYIHPALAGPEPNEALAILPLQPRRYYWNRRKAVTGVNGLTCHVRKHRGRSKAAMKPANAQNGKGLSPLPAPILRFSVTIRKTFQNLKEPPCAATEERPSRGIRRVALGRIGKLVLVLVGDRPDEYEYVAGSVLLSNCLHAQRIKSAWNWWKKS